MQHTNVLGLLVGLLVVGLAIGSQAEDLSLRESPQGTVFGNERLAVRLDPKTGWPGEVLSDGRCVVQAAESRQHFDIKQDESWVTGGGAAIEPVDVKRVSADTICVRMKAGDWTVDAYVQLFPDQRMLRRWFEIAWNGEADTKIKGFWFQAGQTTLTSAGNYLLPADYPPRRVTAGELVPDRRASNGRSPYPVIADRGDGWSAVWLADESPDYSDRGSSGVVEGKDFVRVTQSFNMQGHVRRGKPQKVGDAWLWLQPNDSEQALMRMGEWFRQVGQMPPDNRPEWLKRVILYSFHPGGTIGSQCRDLGGFQAATKLLPHIRRLGCNAIWLMPLEDKSIYWPRDYYKFQDGLGTGEDYKALSAKAHALGMRVWQDCVPHGGSNEFPRAKEHPEWLAQNEDGSTLHYWCFDFNWPTWIDYMSDVVSFYTREYGLDGFRIDACGGSKIPNWNPAIPYARASLSQAQGGLAMQRALRRAVKAIRPDGANLAEVGASIHGTVSDSTYDFRLCYQVLHDFRKEPADVFGPRLRRWLHEQQCAEVPDLVRMRHLESHDSLRSALWYGAEPQRALLALISWIHGIPMVYHEIEDGNFDAYRKIFHVRSHVTELNGGKADYLAVSAPEGVFACLRFGLLPSRESPAWDADYEWDISPTTAERASIVQVNLDGRTAQGQVSLPVGCLPESLRGSTTVRDLVSGANLPITRDGDNCRIDVAMPPFAYTVLRFASEPLPGLEEERREVRRPERTAKETRTFELTTEAGTLRIDPSTGLATEFEQDGMQLAGIMDLALPAGLVRSGENAACHTSPKGVEVTRRFGSHTLQVRYLHSADGGVEVEAVWEGETPEGAAIVVDVPGAATWQAQSAEGFFESPFRVRHPDCDGVVGSIYRLPQGTAVLWDSRHHPFGLSPDRAWVGALLAGGKQSQFNFDPSCLPGSVQLLDRTGDRQGLKVLIAWQAERDGAKFEANALRFRIGPQRDGAANDNATGDERLRLIGGGWEFENPHYRARVARTGALTGLWRKEATGWRQMLRSGAAYTDKGFGDGIRYGQENDVEAAIRIEQHGADIVMQFCGEMRGFGRFDKMAHPVRFFTSYTFGDSPAFRYACAVEPQEPSVADYAFLSLLLRTAGGRKAAFADSERQILSGEGSGGRGRFAQLAQSKTPDRMPTDVRLSDAEGLLLRLGDMAWFGAPPQNVFMDGEDLHLAWMDGKPQNRSVGQWSGLTCSVACEDVAVSGDESLPLVRNDAAGLLHNGDFDQSDQATLVLLLSGETLPRTGGQANAWQLPPGVEYVEDNGNRCVQVEGDGQSYRLIRQAVSSQAMKPGSRWRLAARMKGEGIERGDVNWKTACLRWSVSVDGRSSYHTVSLPWGDSPWETREIVLTVPEKAERVAIEAGMNGNRGGVWIDDVRIEKVGE